MGRGSGQDTCAFGLLCILILAVLCYIFLSSTARITVKVAGVGHAPGLFDDLSTASASDIIKFNIQRIQEIRPTTAWQAPIAEDMPFDSLYNIVERWNPDVPEVPPGFKESLQHFDYGDPAERAAAERFRNAELPFKLFNVTDFNRVAEKWTDRYLHNNLDGEKRTHVERSKSNHFMYWSQGGGRSMRGFKAPTDIIDMTFADWLVKAKDADSGHLGNATEHLYFMSNAPPRDRSGSFIAKDLGLFSTQQENFFITNVRANKGIQCRFGMRGIIAESHYDSGRNMVVMLKGEKRYILTPPWSCKKLGIISDKKHPSYRHSVIDWSDLQQAASRGFSKVDAIDTIVRTGEVLYIPTYWFHYIVSLRYSIQCNSRSGTPPDKQGYNHVSLCMHN
ncbi:cupin-like domain-containing protein [Ochromonadaceae sp. CCMP2298]|nr:cupin-like domain-containing protein [Ochromonadaceae sp. CCMP2298]